MFGFLTFRKPDESLDDFLKQNLIKHEDETYVVGCSWSESYHSFTYEVDIPTVLPMTKNYLDESTGFRLYMVPINDSCD